MKNVHRLFVICGLVQHGKSTLSNNLALCAGLTSGDCSSIIYRELASSMGVTVEGLRAMDKETIRPALIRTGDRLCDPDPGFLAKELYAQGVRVIAGVRRVSELEAIQRGIGLANVIPVWVTRPGVPEVVDNTDHGLLGRCSVLVHNTGDFGQLLAMAKVIAGLDQNPECGVTLTV